MQFTVGDTVWLVDPGDKTAKVAKGRVQGLAGHGLFHTRPIPAGYVRVNLEQILVNIPLVFPVEAADQVNLEDARGSSVLWYAALTFLED